MTLRLRPALGTALLRERLDRRWLQRRSDGRVLTLTPAGAATMESTFGMSLATIGTSLIRR